MAKLPGCNTCYALKMCLGYRGLSLIGEALLEMLSGKACNPQAILNL